MKTLEPESEAFDANAKTGDIVRKRLVPGFALLAKRSSQFKAIAGALAMAAILGAGSATCRSNYQTRAAAKELEDRLALEVEAARRDATQAQRDAAEVKATQPLLRDELRQIHGQVDRLVDVLIDRPAERHGRR